MKACWTFLLGILGIVLLLGGATMLILAQVAPRLLTETRELGGASQTQQVLATQADLPLTIDGTQSTTSQAEAVPLIEAEAAQDIASLDNAEIEAQASIAAAEAEVASAVPNLQAQASAEDQSVFAVADNNIALSADSEVAVVPLEVAPSGSDGGAPSAGQGGAFIATRYEQRVVELEWPQSFPVGGSGVVRVTLRVLPDGGLEVVPEIDDNAVVATPILLSDRYDTHDARVTARLIAPDFEIQSTTPLVQTMERGQEATWRWTLGSPNNSGKFVITLGLDVEWTPKPGSGEAPIATRPIWGQALQVDVNYVFGSITVPQASIAGTILAVLGFVIQIPLLGELLQMFWKMLFGNNKKKKQTTTRRQRR